MRNLVNEKILLYKIKTAKDKDAFAALYDLYVEKIFRFIYFKINSREEAEDLTSDVFLRVWRYLIEDKDSAVRSFSALVYRTARNAVVDKYRERSRRGDISLDRDVPEDEDLVGTTEDVMINSIESGIEAAQLIKNLNKLKQEYRDVLTMRYMDELTYSEIAEILNKSQLTVRVTIHRATKKLKDIMKIG